MWEGWWESVHHKFSSWITLFHIWHYFEGQICEFIDKATPQNDPNTCFRSGILLNPQEDSQTKITFSGLSHSPHFVGREQSMGWRQSIASFLSLLECCSNGAMGLPSSHVYKAQKSLFAQHHKNWPLWHCLLMLQGTQDWPQHRVRKILRSTSILHPAHLGLW